MKLLALVVAGGLAVATGGTAAYALTASSDTTVSAIVKHHPDNGHGTPSQWADDTFIRTMVIHNTGANSYTITTTDKGTFTTRQGAGSPSGAAVQISRKLTGAFSSTSTGHVNGALVANPGHFSGKTFDDTHGTPFPSSGAWAATFFGTGATVNPFDHYSFRYTTEDEKWVDADTNNDGQAPSAGNITGKLSSRLVAMNKCRVRGTNQNRWVIKNVQGDRSRPFIYRVKYHGAWSHAAMGTVTAGGSTTITTATGGYLSVLYMNGYNVKKYISARSKYSTVC
jgi:hypothetical protein